MTHLDAARTLLQFVDEHQPLLLAISDTMAAYSPSPEKWSRKQIVGHLIDSATNNHHRFIRLQLAPELAFPGYQQNEWVDLNGYTARPWGELVALWAGYNRHLAHVIERIDPAALPHIWDNGSYRLTLEFIATDYVDHLRHHLEQIADAARF